MQAAGRWYAVMAAEYTGEVKTPAFRECLFGLTGQWPEGEGYAAWQKAKLPRLRLGVPDGTELAKEMDELRKGESKGLRRYSRYTKRCSASRRWLWPKAGTIPACW